MGAVKNMPSPGDTIQFKNGVSVKIDGGPIGAGAQGVIYKAKDTTSDRLYAVKCFKKPSASNENFISNIKKLCETNSVSDSFVWPISYNDTGKFDGYLMEYIDKEEYEPLKNIMYGKSSGHSFKLIALAIAETFMALHDNGLYFCDINEDDIFVNQKDGELRIKICDCDNITTNGKAEVSGKEGFIAPELLIKRGQHGIGSDVYSIAVIIFKLLVRFHPLEGKLFMNSNDEEKKDMYGRNALFVFDDLDRRNNPLDTKYVEYWNELPHYISNDLFMTTFTIGLFDADSRPRMPEWVSALSEFINDDECEGNRDPIDKKILNIFFIVDTSGSMLGSRIDTVNEQLRTIGHNILENVPQNIKPMINILTFDDDVKWIFDKPVETFETKEVNLKVKNKGNTRMDLAIEKLNLALKKKNSGGFIENNIVTPMVILISDGEPTISIESYMDKIKRNRTFLNSLRFAFILDKKCNSETLCEFTGIPEFVLKTYDLSSFEELFKFITLRSSQISSTLDKKEIDNDEKIWVVAEKKPWAYTIPGAFTTQHKTMRDDIVEHNKVGNSIYYSGWI